MTPNLKHLHPYPFEKLAQLKHGIVPPKDKAHIALSMGEPTHATPHLIQEALLTHLHGLSNYPTTKGILELRQAIANWISRRFQIPADFIDAETQVLPVNGTREALFSFAQCLIDSTKAQPVVIMPNPFYQIYEGAALLAGAEPYFLNTLEESAYLPDFDAVPEEIWQRCQLIYICSPGNPTGAVIDQASLEKLLKLAEKYDFVIASDECYSEIYDDEANPPPSLLQTAYNRGNTAFKRCVVFHSLSKRSNAPGLRSGFVAGDAELLKAYFHYRTYHGCVMPLPTQHASIQAWQDEAHVIENRRLYREKFAAFIELLGDVCTVIKPPASFYVWLKTPIADTEFARQLFAQQNITVLPGSFLSRDFDGINPGLNHVRIALVAPLEECKDAANRIKIFLNSL
ncbi:MAG: succinyldiaminopimelate transaminase [Methylobacter sp.]|nr:succinyldiaminopimelate transaminase [Methylobacter sp.]MDP2098528.1 succinyldiaminopimelate transaminase [Methylobacter sp.]MDP2428241.1 succinyldiaminopimelate transaminase [Methylobacter sp.]MDP3053754.1 succinyldiaminopimelate transaminase [Methylobacter sp.]MDP3363975.1 succinyldiaminopimelate transaminase [Methylobacter sp.]